MKALLISPRFEDTFWNFRHALEFIGAKAAFIPLGLLTLAGMFPKKWEIRLVDMNVRPLTETDILWADCVFVSAMIAQTKSVKEVVSRCSRAGKRIVLGGPILETEEFCDHFPGVSHYFLGEAENTFPKFLDDIEKGSVKRVYKPTDFPDLVFSPMPRYDLVSPKNYGSGGIQESRGCPFGCSFCNVATLNGPRWRSKTPEHFWAELDALYRAGFRGPVQVFSDNFVGNIAKVKILLREIIKWQKARRYPFDFTIEAAVIIADHPDLMQLMVAAGIKKVFLGLETNNQECLKECHKRQNVGRDMIADCKMIMRYGLIPMSGFMVGFENDSPDTFDADMIQFIQDSGVVVAMVDILQAQHGTLLYDKLKRENRLSGNPVSNTAWEPNFAPKMPVETLTAGYRRIVETTNFPRQYYERICVFLENYNVPNRPKRNLSFRELKALFKSVWKIGICEEAMIRRYYWKTFFTALFKNPRAFAEAITFQIYGYHFRKSKRH